tara:strand:+ start:20883 stop:21323 length:441 start_codon:yes stop_codon:yes gene_type:complete
MRRIVLTLTTFVIALAAAASTPDAQSGTTISGFPAAEDGASLSFPLGDTRLHVRFDGVTAPAPTAYPYGAWAYLALGDAIAGNEVTCRLSADHRDAVCTAPGLGDLARWAVMNGFAVPEPGPAGDPYVKAAREARAAKRGIWGGAQ